MSGFVIETLSVLSAEDCASIDAFGTTHLRGGELAEVAAFLSRRFNLQLTLDPDIVIGFAGDSSNLPGKAQAVARPADERECAIFCRTFYAAGIPVTVSGGRSNLTGSATPDGGVILSTSGMIAPPVAVDGAGRTATVPVGILLESMRDDVRRLTSGALMFPVDPTSRKEASIGGALSCNASGFTPGEEGAIRAWVEQVRFMLPDGRIVNAPRGRYVSEGCFELTGSDGALIQWPVPTYPRPAIKNAGGPFSSPDGRIDFVDLVVGSEGLFGMVTGCVLRLKPAPADYLDLFISIPDEPGALRLLDHVHAHLQGAMNRVTAFEYFGVNSRRFMQHESQFFKGDDQVAVYVQIPLDAGIAAEDVAAEWLDLIATAECGADVDKILMLDNDRLRTLFMEARHSMPAHAVETVQRRGTFTIMTDTVVPRERFAEFLEFTHALLRRDKLDYLAFGHLGDCHLHFTILPEKDQVDAGVSAYDAIVACAAELGGVYSGEHGTGKRKRKDFLRCHGQAAVDALRRCKAIVDPQFLFNRGNVILAP